MAKKGFHAAPVDASQLAEWDRLAAAHGCLFDSVRWTRLFEPRIRRVGLFDAGGALRGGFCVWEQRKLGLRILRNPPFTPHIGPFFEYRASNAAARTNEERDVMEAMAAWLESQQAAVVSLGLALNAKDCLPCSWGGFKVIPHYTYLLDLNQSGEDLLAGLSSERRKNLRKADAEGIVIRDCTDPELIGDLVRGTFRRNGKRFADRAMGAILDAIPPSNGSICKVAWEDGGAVAGVYIVSDARSAYYLMGGHAEHAHHGAGALAMWHAILKAKEVGLQVFDFEGSVIPPIERYFRGFGGKLTPCFGVHRAWLPVEMALKLVRRHLF
ncbi:MAG TPA: GNAT family N-acetyltransferase [Thermoanaerobaculaceae bacterium]|nr:GNAT family N-acetyltransferase [Thermoanaerobaculaceae bacterium]